MFKMKLILSKLLPCLTNLALLQVEKINLVGTSLVTWLVGVINGSYERRIQP